MRARAGSFDVSGRKREPLIVRLTWRGHLVLIAGVAVLVLAGTAAGHDQRTDIRQGGAVVAWVNGGGPIPRSWSYCDNKKRWRTKANGTVGYTLTSGTTLWGGPSGSAPTAGRYGPIRSSRGAPSSSEASLARVHPAGTSSVLRDSPSTANGCGSNLVSLLRPWGAMASRLAHRSSSNPALAGEDLTVFVRREDAERFIEEVRGEDPEVAAKLRVEERELEAGGQN